MSQSLEEKIRAAGDALKLLRGSSSRPETGPLTGAEVSNWRDEQAGWRETCAMFDLSHHMTDIILRGPDALRLVSHLGVNSWANFQPGRAKQIVSVNEDGFVIGDSVAEYLENGDIRIAGSAPLPNWIHYNAEHSGFDVEYHRDEMTALNPAGHPAIYRFQLQGPLSLDILAEAADGAVPEIKFFRASNMLVAGVPVIALGHGMARSQGFELIGPWKDSDRVREALIRAGERFDLRVNGSRAPGSATLESGWLPAPLPAIYTGDALRAYREWLPGSSHEGTGGLGGSFESDDISDYYMTPHDLNYMRIVNFDHEFIGRDALMVMRGETRRRKVTLEWNTQDVLGVIATQFEKGVPGKAMEFPIISYSTWQYDKILRGEHLSGVSTFAGYSYNERKILSLATVDPDVADGSEIQVVWGDADGGTSKAHLEPHRQIEVRAKICRVPYSEVYYK